MAVVRSFLESPRRAALALAAAAAAGFLTAPAAADSYVDRANALYNARIPQDQRSDLIILPLVGKMDEPPASVRPMGAETFARDLLRASLLPATSGDWREASAWAMAEPQRAALEGLARVTEDEGPQTSMVFAQPYGVESVPVELVMQELYTELGDPPSLAEAEILFLPRLRDLAVLAHVEATRLLAEGDPRGALEVTLDALFFARQIADREFADEKALGMIWMGSALERLRDIAYQDFRSGSPALTSDGLREIVRRIDERRSALGIERIGVPRADRIAAEQLIARLYRQGSQPDRQAFGPTLARLSVGERPLRLFSEAAKWEALRGIQAEAHVARQTLENVYNDWARRWGLNPFDPVMRLDNDYVRVVRGRPPLALLEAVLPDIQWFFGARQSLRVEAAGARMALAMYAYTRHHNQIPLDLTAVRPNFAQVVDTDPHSPTRRNLEFFVPIRDFGTGDIDRRPPSIINVYPGEPYSPFQVRIGRDQFILYSVGRDEDRGWAQYAVQGDPEASEGDYLLWPPVMSLLRQHLLDQGRLR